MAQQDAMLDYLTSMSDMIRGSHKPRGRYCSQEEFILNEGRSYGGQLTASELDALRPALVTLSRLRPKVKECFCNAFHLADIGQQLGLPLDYVEGIGLNLIHTLHAWVTFNGKPVDVTWRKHDDNRRSVPAMIDWIATNAEKSLYRGVVIPLDYMRGLMLKHRLYCSAIDNWQDRWPLLREGLAALSPIVSR